MKEKKTILELTQTTAEAYRQREKLPLSVMADNIRSMHNIGSLFRTADAFLIREIVLAGICAVPPQPEIAKTALGAEDSVAWRYVPDSVREVERMKAEGWIVCVLEQAHDSVDLYEYRPAAGEKILLVAGNETEGVDQRIVDLADHILELPQHGIKHSLNVSVSAGIALWHISRALENL